ncbi:MAG: hypothetical protein VW200_03595 [Pelagibacteraceae bacterium]|jgi:hypothetical protein
MPIRIKIFLTSYIIVLSLLVIFYENFFGQSDLIYILVFLSTLMTIGIWIFPEVVTKQTTSEDDIEPKNN